MTEKIKKLYYYFMQNSLFTTQKKRRKLKHKFTANKDSEEKSKRKKPFTESPGS